MRNYLTAQPLLGTKGIQMIKLQRLQTLFLSTITALFVASCDDNADEKELPPTQPSTTEASVSVIPAHMTISEVDQSGKLTLKLSRQPTADVRVKATILDTTEATITPQTLTIASNAWDTPVSFIVDGIDDKSRDGEQKTIVRFSFESEDEAYHGLFPVETTLTILDDGSLPSNPTPEPEQDPVVILPSGAQTVRLMAANITSGSKQQYEAEGIRIFHALQPDIIMIQEFNHNNDAIKSFVTSTFGSNFVYARSVPNDSAPIPNGIISRFPILESGHWRTDNTPSNRNYDWALIDLPGNIDLLAVSVHLLTNTVKQKAEMKDVAAKIETKLAELRKANPKVTYAAVIGGDFNTKSREYAESQFSKIFQIKSNAAGTYPVDQNDNANTSGERDDPYDWLLVTPNFDPCETPVIIGKHSYPNGHVFDSRVYGNASTRVNKETVFLGCTKHDFADELADLPSTVKVGDSDATNMQHMAVIRDFVYTLDDTSTNEFCHFK